MKKMFIGLFLFTALVVLLQNCGNMTGSGLGYSSSSLSALYPYHKSAPSYFADVQIIDKVNVGSPQTPNYSYRFIASAVSTSDENANIDVEILVMDSAETLVCPRIIESVNRTNNHLEVDSCFSSDDLNSITIKVFAGPVGGDLVEVRSQTFDLSGL